MDILDDMGVNKLSVKVIFFKKVNYSFKSNMLILIACCTVHIVSRD